MAAVELGRAWLGRGDLLTGQCWLSRAHRLLDGSPETVAHGYLRYLDAIAALLCEDTAALAGHASALEDIAARAEAPVLEVLGLVMRGTALLFEGRGGDAFRTLDEVMLCLHAADLPPPWVAEVCCLVVHHCFRLGDLRRVRAWTWFMQRWRVDVESATHGVACRLHRMQALDDHRQREMLLLLSGEALEHTNSWFAGEAYRELGIVRGRLGDLDGALWAFGKARELGVEPEPGEAQVRCLNGDPLTAWAHARVALAGAGCLTRAPLLRGAIGVALACDNLAEAEGLCDELEADAAEFGTPGYAAWAAHSRGALLVRRGRHEEALRALERALKGYRTQQDRWEIAQVYSWMGLARRGLGADDIAKADEATAQIIYRQLGLEPGGVCGIAATSTLTHRETEVLATVARGLSNSAAARTLAISEKTVARHLANIYVKLGVRSRTAAAAWAHRNRIWTGSA